MNNDKIYLIEFPSNLGLKKKENDSEPGVKWLPDWFRKHKFHELIKPENVFSLTPPDYAMELDEESGVRNAGRLACYAHEQSRLLIELLNQNYFQIILGGDCSILIGTALALRQKGQYGLFFLDGHTDFMGPELSTTGGAAGMDLAIVTGHGHDKLTNLLNLKPYFNETNVFCVGNREYDADYIRSITKSAIRYFDLVKLRETGIRECVTQFLKMVNENQLDGFFIHLDVDVLDDDVMPAVDSRKKGGISYAELGDLLRPLLASSKAVGIEITILDPNLDPDGRYTTEFVAHFVPLLESARDQ